MSHDGLFGGFRAAVSLTFDDGTTNQLERAVPVLDEFGIRGTFYLHARDHLLEKNAADWRAVGEAGHEIGNHTRRHRCPNSIHGRRGGVDDLTIDDIVTDILQAQERLETIAPHQDAWTFAYPCGATHVGNGLNRVSYVPVVARYFLAGRALGEYGFNNHPDTMDSAALLGQRVDRMSGQEMVGLVQSAIDVGEWAILCFHDISGMRISVEEAEFRHLLSFLADRRSEVSLAPVADVMKGITESADAA